MLGWESRAAAMASWRKRTRVPSSAARSERRILTATRRESPPRTVPGAVNSTAALLSSADDLVGHSDDPRAGMGPDDRSDHTGDDVVAREDRFEQREELVDVGRIAVEDGEVLDLPFRRLRGEQFERLRTGAHLPRLFDDAVAHLDHGLDREHRAQQRAGVADPAAALEELERVERREQLR